jgi:tetratricopeptide (TPR) repeat protein/transglutaminase-like putative cysteine protease
MPVLFAAVDHFLSATYGQNAPPRATGEKGDKPPTEAAFSFERLYTQVRFENDGSVRLEHTYWIKVLDEQAVRQFGEFPLVYESETEDLNIREIAVQKPDGTVTRTPSSGVQDLSAMPPQLAVFLDVRQKVASVSALRPGDVLRIDAVWTVKKPIAPGHFWFEYSFDKKDVVRDEQLEIDLPADRPIALKVVPTAPTEDHAGSGVPNGGRRVYHWRSVNASPTKDPVRSPWEDLPPADVRLSSFRTWDDFARWFTPLAVVKPDDAVKAKATSLISGAPDDAATVSAIYHFVSTQIRYLSLSFGLGRFAAHAPADVLKNQYGDCKDKAVLIEALLAAAGTKALPVLVNTQRSITDDFASPLEFDHMIAMAPRPAGSADKTWMDPTTEVAPIGMLAFAVRGRRALVLDGAGHGTVTQVPADLPFPQTSDVTLDGAVNPIGVLTAKVTITLRGDQELDARVAVRAIPRSALQKFFEGVAEGYGIEGDVSEVETTDPTATADPFRITFHLRRQATLDWAATTSDMKLPVTMRLPVGTEEARKDLHRIVFAAPGTRSIHQSLELPAGYEATAPAPIDVTRAGLTYRSSYAAAGRRITASRDFLLSAREMPESAFKEYSALSSAADADNAQPFKIKRTTTDAPAIPSDATAGEVYAAGQSAWDARRYNAAATMYKRVTELDPKDRDGWDALGLAYRQLKKYPEAEAAIRKTIELDPYSKRAYSDLGSILEDAGRKKDAAEAYSKHVELNPLDGESFKQLGFLYDDLDRYSDEAAALEKASTLVKPDAWVFARLGGAYALTKNPDKARRAFDRALELESSPALWTKVAWSLAEGGIDLDRAEELARKSEKQLMSDGANLELKTLTNAQLASSETLAWTWDAIGWARFQRGDLKAADDYTRAAWLLGGFSATASHVGQVSQKRDKLADALSFYLTAESMTDHPTPELIQRVKSLAGGGDLKLMLDAARRELPSYRFVHLSPKRASGRWVTSAEFVALVNAEHRAVDVRFENGTESLRALEDTLRLAKYPIEVPGTTPTRVPIIVKVSCDEQQICAGFVDYPYRASLKK